MSEDGYNEDDELARVLGDDRLGFHIEFYGHSSNGWDDQRRGDGARFPCLDDLNVYSGCLGRQCEATTCWAGRLVPSAVHSRLALPMPMFERAGCTCHTCAHAIEVEGTMIDCAHGHFDRPITHACLVRKRVPDTVEVPCPDYQRAAVLRPEVEEYRRRKRAMQARAKARRLEAPGHR